MVDLSANRARSRRWKEQGRSRQVVPGRTYLISRRCSERRFLLRPEPRINQIVLYCLGEAAQRFDVTVHGWIAMSNHLNLLRAEKAARKEDEFCS